MGKMRVSASAKKFVLGLTREWITRGILLGVTTTLISGITLQWDPNQEPDLAGYRIYYGELEQPPDVIEVRTNEVALTDLIEGVVYYFYATAFNVAGLESEPSLTVFFDPIPKIAPIQDVAISLFGGIPPIDLTVTDFDTPLAELSLSASSADELILPSSHLLVEGTTGSRMLRILPPVFPVEGEVQVTITVSDGYSTTEESFLVQFLLSGNSPPSISNIGDISIREDEISQPVRFVLNDGESAMEELSLIVFTSDPGIISSAGIIIAGDGAERALLIEPETDQYGAVLISVEVSDGEFTVETTFEVEVQPVNDPPVVSEIENQQTISGLIIGPLTWVIEDIEMEAGLLELTAESSNPELVPEENIALEGFASERTVTVTPAPSATGTATITLTAGDGESQSSSSFEIRVGAPPTLTIAKGEAGEIIAEVHGGVERDYFLEISADLNTWTKIGPVIPGEVWIDPPRSNQLFYRVVIY